MKKIRFLYLFLFAFFAMASFVSALDSSNEDLILYMGEVKVMPVSNPGRIAIGNPAIADVVSVSKTSITLNPKAPGQTSFVFWDSFGEQAFTIHVFSENMADIKQRIDGLLKKINLASVYTQASDQEAKVYLLGKVKNSIEKERMFTALGALKDKTLDLTEIKEEAASIEIDVQVIEVDKDASKVLGFTNPLSTAAGFGINEIGSAGISPTGVPIGSLFRILNFQRDAYAWKLYALEEEGKARILSRPRLSCQSGKEAELLVGGEKPIFTTQVASGGGSGTSVEYKEFGIKLKIKPTITEEKTIKVGLSVEVSELGEAETIGTVSNTETVTTAKAYPMTKRTASTELYVGDGQSMVIGGLIKRKSEENISKTPGFGDMPIFGMFFRKRTTLSGGGTGERGDVELFIILTPKLVNSTTAANETESASKIKIPSSAAPALSDSSDPLVRYRGLIQSRIVENLVYPPSARSAGFEGTVKLALVVAQDGKLKSASVKESSGYKALDDSALSVAQGIAVYPPFPPSLDSQEITVDVPVAYRLN